MRRRARLRRPGDHARHAFMPPGRRAAVAPAATPEDPQARAAAFGTARDARVSARFDAHDALGITDYFTAPRLRPSRARTL